MPPALRDDLITYLFCTSPDRARIIAELMARNPGIGDLLIELEADARYGGPVRSMFISVPSLPIPC
jgi:hypothetical protein